MFGIGLPELIVILGLALIVVGPDKLPDLARSIAKGILELKKTAEGVKEGLTKDGGMFDDLRPELDAVKTLQKELAISTDIDWKKDYSTDMPDTPPAKTDTPGGSTELPGTPSEIIPEPVAEEREAANDTEAKKADHPDHHS